MEGESGDRLAYLVAQEGCIWANLFVYALDNGRYQVCRFLSPKKHNLDVEGDNQFTPPPFVASSRSMPEGRGAPKPVCLCPG